MKQHYIKTIFLCLSLLAGTNASAQTCIDGIYYKLHPRFGATVTYRNYSGGSYSGTVIIPDTITYNGKTYKVSTIGTRAFYNCHDLNSVTIGNNVTRLDESAFCGCSDLESINIPNSVTKIGNHAFHECSGLTSVTIGNSVTSIGESAFSGCSGLTSVTIPNSVTSIGSSAFSLCSGLTSVTIPESVTSIGSSAFANCSGLTSVTIPESVTSIGGLAFYGCSGLTSIAVKQGNTVYDSRNNCNAIIETATNTLIAGCVNTTIPNSVTNIGRYAFSGCSGLTSVTIPNSVTNIGEAAFSGCSGLTSVTIPESVANIGDYAFDECSGLTSVTIPNSVTSISNHAFQYCSGLTSITIPNSVTSIGNYAFQYCGGLTSITIPNSVTSIGDYAFYKCSGLTSVTIPNSVTIIGEAAFADCNSLTSITIPNSVTSIGEAAFSGCNSLTSITIPNSVTSIGYDVFSDCSSLTSMVVDSGNNIYDSRNNCNAIIETATNTLVAGCINTTIPSSVTKIGSNAFYSCNGLTSVTIPESVTSIGDGAFMYCSDLTSILIPEGVTNIGDYAFYGCTNLASITIPNSVTTIGGNAFGFCGSLTYITIPENVTSIGGSAFDECYFTEGSFINNSSLTSDTNWGATICEGTNDGLLLIKDNVVVRCRPQATSITIPDNVIGIGRLAFYFCTNLTSISIPNSVTNIDYGAFWACIGLTSVTIPESMTTIGTHAFRYCHSLTSVTIPSSVTSIDYAAFENCSHLTSVYSYITNPFRAMDIFDINSDATLYVPTGTKALYEEAGWAKYFGEVIEMGAEDVFTANTKEGVTMTFKILSNDERTCQVGNGEEASVSTATSGQVTVPEEANGYKVTAIGDKGFYNCSKLTHIWLHEGIEHIGKLAFYGCTGLQVLDIPHSVVDISDDAFEGCTNLQVNIPSDIIANLSYNPSPESGVVIAITPPSVDDSEQLKELERIYIPRAVTNIEERSFSGCKSVKVIEVDAENPVFDSRGNCNAIIRTADNTLLFGCQNTVIPKTVTGIAPYAFEGHSNLQAICIPYSVTAISMDAFAECSSLTSVTVEMEVPVPITENTFSNRRNATLCVPAGCKAAYAAADYWKEFKNIVEAAPVLAQSIALGRTRVVLAKDETEQLTAELLPKKTTKKTVTWQSSNTRVATVTANGLVTAKAFGETTITAATQDGTELSTTCTVTVDETSTKAILHLADNRKAKYLACDIDSIGFESDGTFNEDWEWVETVQRQILYFPNNQSDVFDIAQIDSMTFVEGLPPVQLVTEIVLSDAIVTLEQGDSKTLKATVLPADAENRTVTWESTDEAVAQVSSTGKVTAIGVGTCKIVCRATDGSGIYTECQMTVIEKCLSCPDDNHPHAIDLGLPSGIKWCCCNVGAEAPEDYGGYYPWGEMIEKTVYNEVNYPYYNGTDNDGDGWIDQNLSVVNIGSSIAGTKYDTAKQLMGAPWRMPTFTQMNELRTQCTFEWTEVNGVEGIRVTGPSERYIFMPAAGNRWNVELRNEGTEGGYWTSSVYSSDNRDAYELGFGINSWGIYNNRRYDGRSVRAVCR